MRSPALQSAPTRVGGAAQAVLFRITVLVVLCCVPAGPRAWHSLKTTNRQKHVPSVSLTWCANACFERGRGSSAQQAPPAAAATLLATLRTATGAAPQSVMPEAPRRRRLNAALPRPMALEQRFMFDGAAFGDVVNVVDRSAGDVVRHAGSDRFAGRVAPSAAREVPASAALAGAPLPSRAPAPLEDRVDARIDGQLDRFEGGFDRRLDRQLDALADRPQAETVSRPTGLSLDIQAQPAGEPATLAANLKAAQAEAERLVTEFLSRPDAQNRLFQVFQGSSASAEPSAAWNEAAQSLLQSLTSAGESVRVELRSGAEMPTARGAFAAAGPQALQSGPSGWK